MQGTKKHYKYMYCYSVEVHILALAFPHKIASLDKAPPSNRQHT